MPATLSRMASTAFAAGGVGISLLLWYWQTPRGAVGVGDQDYEDLTADEKAEMLYARCLGWERLSGSFPLKEEFLKHFMIEESFGPTFTYLSDELYPGQFKAIHSVGCVAKGVFESNGKHPFTGVLASKSNPIIIRTSHAGRPCEGKTIPGLAVKFLRTGHPSVNTFALNGFEGIEGGNFFSVGLSNHLPEPQKMREKAAQIKFEFFSPHSSMLGLGEFGQRTVDGEEVPPGDVRFPFQILFKPNPDLAAMPVFQEAQFDTPIRDVMGAIKPGTKLFDVLAVAEPGEAAQPIGTIKTETELIGSRYGDTKLFFRHIRMMDDLKIRPEWTDKLHIRQEC